MEKNIILNDIDIDSLNQINGGDFIDAVGMGVVSIGVVIGAAPLGAVAVAAAGVAGVLGTLDAHSW